MREKASGASVQCFACGRQFPIASAAEGRRLLDTDHPGADGRMCTPQIHKIIREAFRGPENCVGPGPYKPRIDANGRHWIANTVLGALDAAGYRITVMPS